jgi:tetratricopeptide (TPR) repeat protein
MKFYISGNNLLRNDYDEALKCILECLDVEPNKILYYLRLAFILTFLDRFEEALFYLDKIDTTVCTTEEIKLRLINYAYLYYR